MSKLSEGSQLGKWTLVTRLGKGGNGVVWECQDSHGNRAAIKVLKSDLLEYTRKTGEQERRSKRKKRFIDEIQFLRQCNVDGIIPLIDSYLPETPSTTNPPWLVMPIGESLPVYLSKKKREFQDVVQIFRELACTLVGLHAKNITHRDIKPENVLIIDGVPFLSDFGLVHFVEKDPNTTESEILGPLFYLAPEMMGQSTEVNPKSADIYSLAKSFWVSATGQRFPLPGEQRVAIPALRLSTYITDPRAQLLDKLIDKCTRHSPQERPTANEIWQELTAWGSPATSSQEPVSAVTQIARSFASTVATTQSEFAIRKQMCMWGNDLMDTAASKFRDLVDALSNFGFTDQDGSPLPARLIQGEGNPIWDQWTFPHVLVEETPDLVWRGAAGTIVQFVQANGPTALLISGIRILVREDQSVVLCAAHVCIADGGIKECQVVWREEAKSEIGSAAADKTVRILSSQLLVEAPKATEAFKSMIALVVAKRRRS
jgi:serine/threonine protein kinase